MYLNNNYSPPVNQYQLLQQQIQTLNNQFLSWKRIVLQFPSNSTIPQHPIIPEINYKIDHIYNLVVDFCRKFDRQLICVKQKQQSLQNNDIFRYGHTEVRSRFEQQKLQAVNNKISFLEENLRKTQENEKKLVNTINQMMKKYQNQSEKSRSSVNEEYYVSTFANEKAKSQKLQKQKSGISLFPLNLCGKFDRHDEDNPKSTQMNKFSKRTSKNNIYILPEQSYSHTLDYSTQSQAGAVHPENHLRMFSQPDNKASSKQLPKASGGLYRIYEPSQRQSRITNSDASHPSRHLSLDRHGHRLKFMMDNLNQ